MKRLDSNYTYKSESYSEVESFIIKEIKKDTSYKVPNYLYDFKLSIYPHEQIDTRIDASNKDKNTIELSSIIKNIDKILKNKINLTLNEMEKYYFLFLDFLYVKDGQDLSEKDIEIAFMPIFKNIPLTFSLLLKETILTDERLLNFSKIWSMPADVNPALLWLRDCIFEDIEENELVI